MNKAIDIDIIKWTVEKAEEYILEEAYYPDSYRILNKITGENIRIDDSRLESSSVYRDCIQGAIEGIRSMIPEYHELEIDYIVSWGWSFRYGNYTSQDYFNLPGQAKESALKYVYEQEMKCQSKQH